MKNRIPLFYAITAIFWFALYTYVPYISPYSEYLGADLRMIGLIVGAYGFTQMLIRFPLGILSDKLGKRKLFVLLGLFFTAISGIIVFLWPSPIMLLLSRSFGGVAAATWVTFAILGTSYYPASEAAKSVGFMNSANSLGRILAFVAGGIIAHFIGIPHAFLLGGMAGAIGLIIGLGLRETKAEDNENRVSPRLSDLLAMINNKQLLIASFMAILCMYISFATIFGFTPLLAEEMGASSFQLGMIGMTAAIPGLIVSPLAGTVIPRKLGKRYTVVLGYMLAAVGSGLLILATDLWQIYVVQIIISTGTAIAYTLLMGLSISDIPENKRATAMGFFQAVYGLGMFIGPFVTGWIGHSFGLNIAFTVTSGVGVLGIVSAYLVLKNDKI